MITRTLLVVGALSLPNLVCFAGEKEVVSTPTVPVQQSPNRDSLWYADTEFSYTFGSKFKRESDYYHRGPIFRSKGAAGAAPRIAYASDVRCSAYFAGSGLNLRFRHDDSHPLFRPIG
jgi:hypothetical protein